MEACNRELPPPSQHSAPLRPQPNKRPILTPLISVPSALESDSSCLPTPTSGVNPNGDGYPILTHQLTPEQLMASYSGTLLLNQPSSLHPEPSGLMGMTSTQGLLGMASSPGLSGMGSMGGEALMPHMPTVREGSPHVEVAVSQPPNNRPSLDKDGCVPPPRLSSNLLMPLSMMC